MLKFQKLGAHIQRCSNAIKAPLSKVPDTAKQLAQDASERARAAASHLLAEAGKQLNRAGAAWRGHTSNEQNAQNATAFRKTDADHLAHPVKAEFSTLDQRQLNQAIQRAESRRARLQADSDALSMLEFDLKKEILTKKDALAATSQSLRSIVRHALSKFENLPNTHEKIEALRFSDAADQKKHADYLQLKKMFSLRKSDVALSEEKLQNVKNQKALLHMEIAKIDCDLGILRTHRALRKARIN